MIYFLSLLMSLCIQFSAVDFPINITQQNNAHLETVISIVNNYNSTYNKSVDFHRVIITTRNNNTYPYYLWIPIELYDSNTNSSITCNSRTDTYCSVSNVGWIRYQVMNNNTVPTSSSPSTSSSIGNLYYSDTVTNNGLIYNGYYTLPLNSSDTFAFDTLPELSGHTQSGKNDKILSSLPFPNAPSITGHSSVSTVDDSSTNNLLGNILNTLQVIGNIITNTGNNIITFISDLYGNINDTINYVIEPFNTDEAIEIMKNSHYNGFFEDLKNVKDTFDNLSNSDHVILSFTLPAYLGGETYQFDFAQYFNSSKHIWQPLLLTFLYASLVWGFYKSFANMVNGSSPFVSDVHYQFANDRLQREQASDNHTR